MAALQESRPGREVPPSFAELLQTFAMIGCLSFGGPAGQIALMHRIIVDEKKWLGEERFLHALNFCMLLPGPEAMQLATYAGWSLHGWRGGLASGLLFVLPGAIVILVLSMLYAAFGQVPIVSALFFGIKAAVLVIVVEALMRVARRALKLPSDWWIAAAAFFALYVFDAPFPLVIALAGLVGYFRTGSVVSKGAAAPIDWRGTLATVSLWLATWLIPVALLLLAFGHEHVFAAVALFFSKLAIVTFGGAYAVLAYMAQEAVVIYGWLKPGEMVDGLGLAETTPGPLILVTEFVGYLAGYRLAGGMWGGIAGAVITLWVTFTPCFLWIFAAAPYVERLAGLPRVAGALAAITAAVVGVILNLSLWFAIHVLFAKVSRVAIGPAAPWIPDFSTLDPWSLLLSLLAALALLRFHLGIVPTLALAAAAGLAVKSLV
jgi:chromate transporter